MASTKQEHRSDKNHHSPTGSKLTNTFLNVVGEHFNWMSTHDSEEIKAAKNLLSPSYQFKKSRHEGKVCRVATARKKSLNITQRKRGVDYTCAAQGLIQYSSLRFTVHSKTVATELRARSIEVPVGTGILKLIEMLKADEKKRHV